MSEEQIKYDAFCLVSTGGFMDWDPAGQTQVRICGKLRTFETQEACFAYMRRVEQMGCAMIRKTCVISLQ